MQDVADDNVVNAAARGVVRVGGLVGGEGGGACLLQAARL